MAEGGEVSHGRPPTRKTTDSAALNSSLVMKAGQQQKYECVHARQKEKVGSGTCETDIETRCVCVRVGVNVAESICVMMYEKCEEKKKKKYPGVPGISDLTNVCSCERERDTVREKAKRRADGEGYNDRESAEP